MSEENKAVARIVYEIISAGDFDRAEEIVDASAPDTELLPNDPPAKLIETFKETFSEAREAFPDLSVTVEDLVAEGVRVTAETSPITLQRPPGAEHGRSDASGARRLGVPDEARLAGVARAEG
jgi:hypothetical protein